MLVSAVYIIRILLFHMTGLFGEFFLHDPPIPESQNLLRVRYTLHYFTPPKSISKKIYLQIQKAQNHPKESKFAVSKERKPKRAYPSKPCVTPRQLPKIRSLLAASLKLPSEGEIDKNLITSCSQREKAPAPEQFSLHRHNLKRQRHGPWRTRDISKLRSSYV